MTSDWGAKNEVIIEETTTDMIASIRGRKRKPQRKVKEPAKKPTSFSKKKAEAAVRTVIERRRRDSRPDPVVSHCGGGSRC